MSKDQRKLSPEELEETRREMAKIMCTMAPPPNLSLLPDGFQDKHYKALPFFTPSPAPIPTTAYHNVFPPITSEGIQEAMKRLRELRVPDLCPDDIGFARVDIIKQEQRRVYESAHGPACGCDDCEEERNR